MSLVGELLRLHFAWRYGLPPRTNRIEIHRDIPVVADDGVVLMTDHYEPVEAGRCPTLMMRLPYGRRGFTGIARAYAERGFHVVIQACRGTEASGGRFNPLVNERADGLATLDWLGQQPWFDGRLGLTGPSYLGYAQWAIADAPQVKAMSVKVSSAEFRSVVFPGGAFHLGLWLSWLQTIEGLRGNPVHVLARMLLGDFERRTARAAMTLPLIDADVAAVGHEVWFWNEWFEIAIEDGPFWQAMDHRPVLARSTAPVHLMSGWYDFMIDQLLADYAALVAAGRQPLLTISASTHITGGHEADNPIETLAFMRTHLLGEMAAPPQKPVNIEISGANRWVQLDSFPPPPARNDVWYLHSGHRLDRMTAADAAPSRYRYDPADPTPNLGGAIFAFTGAGPVWQRPLEARPDVLVFTSAPLDQATTIVGNAMATVFMRPSIDHADLFVRLSDVNPWDVSINICDGFVRTTPATPRDASGVIRLVVPLHATAHCFQAGHRLRLLIASGAHPRYARNTGSGEPIGETTRLVSADVEILHDAGHPTAITLPVCDV